MATMATLSETVTADHHQQALAWLVTLWSGAVSAEERGALQHWRTASAAHERAWQEVLQVDGRLRALPADGAAQALRASVGHRRRGGRRLALRALLLVCAGGTALQLVRDSLAWHG